MIPSAQAGGLKMKAISGRSATLLALGFLAGCTVGPDFHRPASAGAGCFP